jgi:plastocyanin
MFCIRAINSFISAKSAFHISSNDWAKCSRRTTFCYFFNDSNQFPLFVAPFSVPASTEFNPLIPSPNLEPLTVLSNDTTKKTVVVANARSLSPIAIDSTGQNVTYLPINANYTMDGTESYLNSGWMWPEGQNLPEAPPTTDFTVTFENPGTYGYVYVVHPWMTGSVVVS